MDDNYSNIFNKEPIFHCPICNDLLYTEWVDNGFGKYSLQASPYVCENCDWCENGCEKCIDEKCFSWNSCKGRAVIK